MIVFWRLVLAYYLADIAFYGRRFYCWRTCSRAKTAAAHGILFFLICAGLTYPYLNMPWPFLDLFNLPGWVCIGLFTLFHIFTDEWFTLPASLKYHHTLTFVFHDAVNLLFLFLCVPFDALYETGHFAAEGWMYGLAGLAVALFGVGNFCYLAEKDKYGRDYPTPDEQWMMKTCRAIFFLIMLLPGWRWVLWLVIWWLACLYARRIRLMDVSNISFYFGFPAAVILGLLVRYRMYLDW